MGEGGAWEKVEHGRRWSMGEGGAWEKVEWKVEWKAEWNVCYSDYKHRPQGYYLLLLGLLAASGSER